MLVECENCGKSFPKSLAHVKRTRHNFCSRKCTGEFNRKKVSVKCSFCGKIFEVTPFRKRQTTHHFCSDDCYRSWKSERFSGDGNPNWHGRTVKMVCEFCGKEMERLEYQMKPHNFCSHECKNKYQIGKNCGEENPSWKPKVKINCEWCGKEVEKHESQLRPHNFCSISCAARWRMKNGMHHGKTKPEKIFEDICSKHNLPFRYTGDASFWIENINPDFV